MKYEQPIMEVMQFNKLDLVRTSDEVTGGLGGSEGGDNGGTSVVNF